MTAPQPEVDICHEFIETGVCGHSDAEHDAMSDAMTAPQPSRASETVGREVLTEAEKDALWEAIERAFLDTTTHDRASEDNIEHAVERIIAARDAAIRAEALAPVLALADEWAALGDTDVAWWWSSLAAALRAAAASPEAGQ